MRLDRLTNKTREALVSAQQGATKNGHPEIHAEHLLLALLAQDEGLAPAILIKAGADLKAVAQRAADRVGRLPNVQGGGEPSMGRTLRAAMTKACLRLAREDAA